MTSRILGAVPLGRLRLAEAEDASVILSLITESMANNFRIKEILDVVYLLETCIISICHLDINETVVGCLVLKDYPLVPSVSPGAWEDFVYTKYKAIELNSRNTLFIHLLCWQPVYAREVVDAMLKSVFMHDHYLQFIGMMKSLINHQVLMPGQSRAEASFRRIQALERGVPGDQLPCLWIADRKEVSPKLRIRRAVEEDNDDIVPIIERHSTWLRELYGDFYVSELVSRHPESERVLLVCEHKELAVGVMCLNTQINYEALEESYELSPFAGLRHLDTPPRIRANESNISLFGGGGTGLESQQESTIELLGPREKKSRVSWFFEEDGLKGVRKDVDRSEVEQVHGHSQLDILQLLEEEDEFAYDIVNIDAELLTLPHVFTSEDYMKKPRFSDEIASQAKDSYFVKDKSKTMSEREICARCSYDIIWSTSVQIMSCVMFSLSLSCNLT